MPAKLNRLRQATDVTNNRIADGGSARSEMAALTYAETLLLRASLARGCSAGATIARELDAALPRFGPTLCPPFLYLRPAKPLGYAGIAVVRLFANALPSISQVKTLLLM
jgi:hypothetical protein